MHHSIILPNQKVVGYPKKSNPLPTDKLSVILDTPFKSDVHFVQYAVNQSIGSYRYNNEIFKQKEFEGKHIDIICVAFDVDSPAKKSKEPGAVDLWFEDERPKIHALLEAFLGGMVWRTNGGWRGVWYCEYRISSTIDAAAWRKHYLASIVRLKREFGIVADSACNDWNRLHRVPRGMRETDATYGWGEPEARETIGRLEEGKKFDISTFATEADYKEARRQYLSAWKDPQIKTKEPKADAPGGVVISGQSVWERALQKRGKIINELAPGKWSIDCPNVSNHSTAGNETSTVLYAPGPGEILGRPYCSHTHCEQLDFQSAYGITNDEWSQLIKEVVGDPINSIVEVKSEPDAAREVISKLICSKNNYDIEPCAQNVVTVLTQHPYWKDCLIYDTFKHEKYWKRVPDILKNTHKYDNRIINIDAVAVQGWFLSHNPRMAVSLDTVREGIQAACHENVIDSLREHVLKYKGKWDGCLRLDDWMIKYLGATDTAINRAIGRRWIMAAVYRALQPGCVADMMLVLEGKQGIGKGYMLKIMFGEEFISIPYGLAVGSKDFDQKCADAWVIHDDELACSQKAGLEPTKSWLTQTTAKYRKAYDKDFVSVPRRFVTVGSTNSHRYLNDSENRRFWPVHISKLDDIGLIQERDQIWAEAVDMCFASYCEYRIQKHDPLFDELAQVHEEKKEEDPLQEKIHALIQSGRIVAPFQMIKVFAEMGFKDESMANRSIVMQISTRLHRLGYKVVKMTMMPNSGQHKWWVKSD